MTLESSVCEFKTSPLCRTLYMALSCRLIVGGSSFPHSLLLSLPCPLSFLPFVRAQEMDIKFQRPVWLHPNFNRAKKTPKDLRLT